MLKEFTTNRQKGAGAGAGLLLGMGIGAAFILGLGISRALQSGSGQSTFGSGSSQGSGWKNTVGPQSF